MPAPRQEVSVKLPIVYTTWTESERGWGSRPDGISIHLTKEDLDAFVKAYNETLPDEVPDEYTRCDFNPQIVEVDKSLYDHLNRMRKDGKRGLRASGTNEKLILKGLNPYLDEKYNVDFSDPSFLAKLGRDRALAIARQLEAIGFDVAVSGDKSGDIIYETEKPKRPRGRAGKP